MKKRITLAAMRKWDAANGDCSVRELEMTVDSVLHHQVYAIQFWADVRLYGMDEAALYVENGQHASPSGCKEIRAKIAELKARYAAPPVPSEYE